jgi:hypothetical protein
MASRERHWPRPAFMVQHMRDCLGCKGKDSLAFCDGPGDRLCDDIIASLLHGTRPALSAGNVCSNIAALDALVQSGAVARQRPAAAMSLQYVDPVTKLDSGLTLLGHLLVKCFCGDTHVECKCLDQVLAWGACPLFVRGLPLGFRVSPLLFSGPMRPRWAQLFIAYGCPPWVHVFASDSSWLLGSSGFVFSKQKDTFSERGQWWRWHGRRGRRLWCRGLTKPNDEPVSLSVQVALRARPVRGTELAAPSSCSLQ